MFKTLEKGLSVINQPIARLGEKLGGMLLLAMSVIVVVQIGFRYFINTAFVRSFIESPPSLDWTDEASRFLMIYMTYLCLPMVYLANKNIAMTLFTDLIKGTRLFVFLMMLTHIIALITFSVWIYFGFLHFQRGSVMADSLPFAMYFIYIAPPVMFIVTCSCALERLFGTLHLLFAPSHVIKKHFEDEVVVLEE